MDILIEINWRLWVHSSQQPKMYYTTQDWTKNNTTNVLAKTSSSSKCTENFFNKACCGACVRYEKGGLDSAGTLLFIGRVYSVSQSYMDQTQAVKHLRSAGWLIRDHLTRKGWEIAQVLISYSLIKDSITQGLESRPDPTSIVWHTACVVYSVNLALVESYTQWLE